MKARWALSGVFLLAIAGTALAADYAVTADQPSKMLLGLVAVVSSALGSVGGGAVTYRIGMQVFVTKEAFTEALGGVTHMQKEIIESLREIRETADDAMTRSAVAENFGHSLTSIDRRLGAIESKLMSGVCRGGGCT